MRRIDHSDPHETGHPLHRPSLQWHRRDSLRIDPTAGELAHFHIAPPHWERRQIPLTAGGERALIFVDQEIVGSLSMAQCDLHQLDTLMRDQGIDPRELQTHQSGPWALGAGVNIDQRITGRLSLPRLTHLLRRCGPHWAEYYARRFGLAGYLALVPLTRLRHYAPALDADAFVQQVQAASIIEPMLTAFLKEGAKIIALLHDNSPPHALVQWRNPA